MSGTTNTNPGNFANRPTEEVKEIASMGGKASHGGNHSEERNDSAAPQGRNPDGTFTKGSEAAKEAGHKGGLHSHDHDGDAKEESHDAGRNADGTFTKGSEAAKEAGKKGGMHSHDGLAKEENVSELEVQDDDGTGRNADGTFKKGSEAAIEAGHKGGVAAAASN